MEPFATRRDLLLTSLLAALPLSLTGAAASPLNPAQTIIKLPDALQWGTQPSFPPGSADTCPLTGDTTAPGLYFVLIRWRPGFMSAPHTYTTDRFCIVVSGTWWVNSGADFDPASCVPAPAGSFVHRVAQTPHYDGVIRSQNEPAVIAICGIGPSTSHSSTPRNPRGGPCDRKSASRRPELDWASEYAAISFSRDALYRHGRACPGHPRRSTCKECHGFSRRLRKIAFRGLPPAARRGWPGRRASRDARPSTG